MASSIVTPTAPPAHRRRPPRCAAARPRRRRARQRSAPSPRLPRPACVRRRAPRRSTPPRAPLGRRHLDQPRGDDRPEDRAVRRQHQGVARRRGPLRLHLADQHRRLPVVRRRRPRPRHHQPGRVHAAPRPDPAHAAADEAPRAERHVLQLVRRGHAARCSRPGRRTATASTRSSPASTTAGSAPRCWSSVRRPGRRPAGRPALRPDALGHVLRRRHRPPRGASGGLIHGGFYDAPPPPGSAAYTGNHIGVGPDVWYTNHHYDTTVSETRITSYLGILTGQIPAKQYFAMWRTFPATLRLVLARDAAGRARTAPTWASTSTRAPTPTAACTSSPAGAAACSRSSCPTCSCPSRAGRRAAGASTTRCTSGPSVSTA